MISSVIAEQRLVRLMVGIALAGAFALAVSSCSPGPSATTSAEAKTFCHDVLFAIPVPQSTAAGVAHFFDSQAIIQAGEHSGDAGLDAAAVDFSKSVNEPNSVAFADALQKINGACTRLGLAPSSAIVQQTAG